MPDLKVILYDIIAPFVVAVIVLLLFSKLVGPRPNVWITAWIACGLVYIALREDNG